jgi:hypothetical protein
MTNETIDPVGIDQSPDPAAQRRAQLAALIPEAFSEGQLDVSALKRALGGEALIEGGERYVLTCGRARPMPTRYCRRHPVPRCGHSVTCRSTSMRRSMYLSRVKIWKC